MDGARRYRLVGVLEIQKLSGDDKEHILFTIDALLRDAKIRKTYAKNSPTISVGLVLDETQFL